MPAIFGKARSRSELLAKVGNMSQLGGIRLSTLDDGPERGVQVADFRTGTGFSFSVLPSRGMDIFWADYCGRSLCWHSPTFAAHPAFYEPESYGWLRGFFGGMLTTCGLTYFGQPCEDQGKQLGLHGRATYLSARHLSVKEEWQGEDYLMWVEGQTHEACLFGENIRLTRRVTAKLGESRLLVDDRAENLAHQPGEHMILYHINTGFPAVEAGAELISPVVEAVPFDAGAEQGKERFHLLDPPIPGYREKCYTIKMAAGPDGMVPVAVVNRELKFGVYLRYRARELPNFLEWKMMGQGHYVVGIEPSNSPPIGRARARAEGALPMLEPGGSVEYHLEIGVLDGASEIAAFEQEVARARG